MTSSGWLSSSDYKAVQSPSLSPKQIKQLSKRLCTDSAAHKEARMTALKQKYLKAEGVMNARKLQGSEQEEFVQRAYEQSKEHKANTLKKLEQKYLGPVFVTRKLTKEEFSNSVDKLYTNSVSQKRSNMEKLERKYLPDLQSKKLDPEQMNESMQRLCTLHQQQHSAMLATLRKKYLFEHPDALKPKLSGEKLTELGQRLCNVDKDETAFFRHPCISEKTRKKLEALYVVGSLPEFPKVPQTKWSETVSRLSKT
jgi:hypothetical protein